MRFLSRSLLGLFLMAVTLGLLTFAAASVWTAVQAKLNEVPFARPAQERVLAVNVLTVTPGTATPSFETFGEVVSRRTLDLRAPSGGPVLRLAENFVEGAAIPAGTLLLLPISHFLFTLPLFTLRVLSSLTFKVIQFKYDVYFVFYDINC